MKILSALANENRTEWDKYRKMMASKAKSQSTKEKYLSQVGKVEEQHNKFYWEVDARVKKSRSVHPMENSDLLPNEIKGQHFNHWTEIAKILGYKSNL